MPETKPPNYTKSHEKEKLFRVILYNLVVKNINTRLFILKTKQNTLCTKTRRVYLILRRLYLTLNKVDLILRRLYLKLRRVYLILRRVYLKLNKVSLKLRRVYLRSN